MWRLRLALLLHASSGMLLREALYMFGLWPGPVGRKKRIEPMIPSAFSEVAKFATVAVSLREAGFTTEAIRWPRDPLALKMLCAWNNVPTDKAPPGWAYHPNDKSFEAWERVAAAARTHLETQNVR